MSSVELDPVNQGEAFRFVESQPMSARISTVTRIIFQSFHKSIESIADVEQGRHGIVDVPKKLGSTINMNHPPLRHGKDALTRR